MKEYIEKDTALETTYEPFTMSMCMTVPECNGMNRAREMISKQLRDIPAADVVEVVRCWECEHWDRDWKSYISGKNKHYCPMIDLVTDADFFCKDGKCKGEGGDK